MSTEVGSLEDPNEGRLVHMRGKKRKLYHSDAKEGKCDSKIVSSVQTQLFDKVACA